MTDARRRGMHASPEEPFGSQTEEVVLYTMLVIVGLIPVLTAIVERAVFGVDATIGLLMIVLGFVGLLIRHQMWTREVGSRRRLR